ADGMMISVLRIGPSHSGANNDTEAASQTSAVERSAAVVHIGTLSDFACSPQAYLDFAGQPSTAELLAGQPQATHYFIQTRGANWRQAALTVKDQTQIIRRFYLLGQSPE